jgi:hypothetical protein
MNRKSLSIAALLISVAINAQTRKTPAPIVDGPDYLASKNAGQGSSPAPAATPNTHTVIAIGLGQTAPGIGRQVPGAIICGDMETVQGVLQWYLDRWSDAVQDAMTNGQARLLRESTVSPDPYLKSLGCTLVPEGTRMNTTAGYFAPIVTATMPNGKVVRGVTLPSMYTLTPEDQEAQNAALRAKIARQQFLPDLTNSPGTKCDASGATCSDAQFSAAVSRAAYQWKFVSDDMKAYCSDKHTLVALETCLNAGAYIQEPAWRAPGLEPARGLWGCSGPGNMVCRGSYY